MRKKLLYGLLGAEAILCTALALLNTWKPAPMQELIAFPFAQVGRLLRQLSLSGSAGNLTAWCLLVLLSLLPLLLLLPGQRPHRAEDLLPLLLCPILGLTMYGMINPALLQAHFGALLGTDSCMVITVGALHSLWISYLILRFLRNISVSGSGRLLRAASSLLRLCMALFVFAAFYLCVDAFCTEIARLQAGNQGSEDGLGMSYVFLTLQLLVNMLPYIADCLIALAALSLTKALQTDAAEAVAAAERLSRTCTLALTTMILSNAAFNLLQVLFASSLRVINVHVSFPIPSILLSLAALLGARLIRENKRLRDDNELFI